MEKIFMIVDNSEFEPGMCSNGGHYQFTRTYYKDNEGKWHVRYDTSHEFGICHKCGDLCQSHQDYELHSSCSSEVSEGEVLTSLIEALKDDSQAMYIDSPAIEIEFF